MVTAEAATAAMVVLAAMTTAATGREKRDKAEKKTQKYETSHSVSAGKFMALYTFRDSSRLQLLVFDVYGS